jgi:hypothetical protein
METLPSGQALAAQIEGIELGMPPSNSDFRARGRQ